MALSDHAATSISNIQDMKHIQLITASLCACLLLGLTHAAAQPLPHSTPAVCGISARSLAKADSLINAAIREGRCPGAVLEVVRHGKVAYQKAYGHRQVYPDSKLMTVHTIFDMASCSKSLSTAICAMQLIEQGRLHTSDAVSRYIPGFQSWRQGTDSATITVMHLLTHTSGLPPYASVTALKAQYGSPNAAALMDYIAHCKRDFRPQSQFQYSCLNFITLQHIIEHVTGQNLRDYAAAHIFKPLGMRHTDYLPCRQQADGRWVSTDEPRWVKEGEAEGLTPIAPTEKQADGSVLLGQVHDPLARVMNGGISGNAGLFSNADDIAILCAALLNGGTWKGHRILQPSTVRLMTTVPKGFEKFGRTPGWDCSSPYASPKGSHTSARAYCHTGYTGTSVVVDPDNDLAIILLTNAVHPVDRTSVVKLRREVANAIEWSR